MELKLKEGVDLSLLTTQHEIELTVVSLLDENIIHLESEVNIQMMISIVNALVENSVYEILREKNNAEIIVFLEQQIQPIFVKWVAEQKNKEIYEAMKKDVYAYLQNKYQEANSIIGLLQNVVDSIRSMTSEDIETMQKVFNNFSNGITQQKAEEKLEETKQKMATKMEELIKSYTEEPAK